ncbi:unnamed protein product [Arabis nemorensis]|uniref:DUF7903 domain-containing protein n=1 Tax=Arabis nemorensis TaxID=586526 RepID=A0A565BHE1_9BRAS|nr:unnamed protein product [Arabis nemorensis]
MSIGESEEDERTQWMLLVAEKVQEDLVLAYERAKTSMDVENHSVQWRIQKKNLLGANVYQTRQAGPLAECLRKNMNKVFYADLPTSYIQHIKSKVVPSHEFCIEEEKERYIVKVELNLVRHLVVDVSCIDKNLDMRLMLTAKRKMTTLTEKEISNIKGLLDPATVDPNVKGGLRWILQVSGLDMSYIPPHEREDPNTPSPVTKSKKNLNFTRTDDVLDRTDELPPSVNLVPLSSVNLVPVFLDSLQSRNGVKPSILMNNNVQKVNMNIGESEEEERTRWLSLVAEKVEEDLLLAYERAKAAAMEDEEHHHVLRLDARRRASPAVEFSRKNSSKMFSTDVPTSYIQYIKSTVVPSHGFCIEEEKERYIVKVSHSTGANETINCKCTLNEDGRLSMYKASLMFFVELNLVRHLVVDVSCIDKNLDMRLMLAAKRKQKKTALTEKEISNIKGLLDSTTVDPNVKGGLRWPPGSGRNYRIFEACHVKFTVYRSQTLRLRVRKTDRFNERIGRGEIKSEVALMLKDINTKLQEQNIEKGCVLGMLKDASCIAMLTLCNKEPYD